MPWRRSAWSSQGHDGKEETLHASVQPLQAILELNTRLFLNVLEGVDDDSAAGWLNDQTKNMLILACHLLDARYYLANYLGAQAVCPFQELFDQAEGFEDMVEVLALEDLRTAWLEVSQLLADHLPALEESFLRSESSQAFAIDDDTVLNGMAFLLEHRAYHLGQLGFLRKSLGLGGMQYS